MESLRSVAVSSPQTRGFHRKPEPQPGLNFWLPPATLSGNLDLFPRNTPWCGWRKETRSRCQLFPSFAPISQITSLPLEKA